MGVLIATALAPDANAYTTVARANQILGRRLYTTKWDSAASTPDAEGYLTNGAPSLGATSIVVDTGTGTFTAGCLVTFAGDTTLYTVSTALSAPGTLVISPGLKTTPGDNAAISRQTANDKEKGLIWATTLFDNMLVWNGTLATITQRLRFPRFGVYSVDGVVYPSNAIPEILEVGTAEFALVLLERNKFKLPGILGQGISSVSLGPLRADVDSKQQEAVIPDNILSLISVLGHLEVEAQTGSQVIPLLRA